MGISGRDTGNSIEGLFRSQLVEWELARSNYRDLEKVMVRTITMQNGCRIRVQFNPARMRSSAAKTDKKSIGGRPCFLCPANLPPQQKGIGFGDRYIILVNPYPIFTRHLTISLKEHKDQLVKGRFTDMLELAALMDGYTLFYNGPRCGASAPDHFHFQAGNKGFMTVESEFYGFPRKLLLEHGGCSIVSLEGYLRHTVVMEGDDSDVLAGFFDKIYGILQKVQHDEPEPMMNILAGFYKGRWRIFIFPRRAHRPVQFYEEGEKQVLISPASVDFGGVWITPRLEDYEKLNKQIITEIFDQVSLGESQWQILIKNLNR